MIYIILIVTSLLSTSVHASRSVPEEYISGIENKLPVNYHKLFKIADKDSPEYSVVAHELTMDLMFIAEQERKAGRLSMSFDFLKLANFLFPHRGDVSKKFQNIAEQVALYLGASSTPCDEYYEIMLRDLKTSFPAMLATIDEKKCETINKVVRDVNSEILALEKKGRDEASIKSAEIQKKLLKYVDKESLTANEASEVLNLLETAYLGNIEFKLRNFDYYNPNFSIILIRKNSAISFEGMKNAYINMTGNDFSSSPLFKKPIKYQLRFIQNDKITTFPVLMKIKNPIFFNIWLNSINFFGHDGYDQNIIKYKNDLYCVEFDGGKIKIELNGVNNFKLTGVPLELLQTTKKIDLIPLL